MVEEAADDTLGNAGSMELIGDGPDKPADEKPDKPTEDKPDLSQENATLKAQLASANETKDYWKNAHDRVTQKPTTSRLATDEGQDPVDDVEEEDLVEILAKGDKKKIKAAFGKLGFAQKGEVDDKLEQKWQTVESAAHVQARHPDITDPSSLLHQETLRQIDSLRNQGVDVPNLLGIAADLAFTTLSKQGKIKPTETNAERIERVGTQQGSLNRNRRNPAEGSDNEGLSESQKIICKKFGLDEKTYAARANKGVRIAGVPKG